MQYGTTQHSSSNHGEGRAHAVQRRKGWQGAQGQGGYM